MSGGFESGLFSDDSRFLDMEPGVRSGLPLSSEEQQRRLEAEDYDPDAILGPSAPGSTYWVAPTEPTEPSA